MVFSGIVVVFVRVFLVVVGCFWWGIVVLGFFSHIRFEIVSKTDSQ